MYRATESVTKAMPKVLRQIRLIQNLPGVSVHVVAGNPRFEHGGAFQQGPQDERINFAVTVARLADHKRPRNVAVVAIEFCAKVNRHKVAGLQRPNAAIQPDFGCAGHDIGELFFVTLGMHESNDYDDALTEDGLLIWKSQNQQTPDSPQIQRLVEHDENLHNVRLFLRTSKKEDYTYMGPLAFNDWDPLSKNPVHFTWRLLNWPLPSDVRSHFSAHIRPALSPLYHPEPEQTQPGTLTEGLPPKATQKTGKGGKGAKGGIVDWAAREQRNRDLGLAGELLVMAHEQKRLRDAGRNDLAARVEHVALSDSAAGYDILSFELDGSEKFIEVKTTTGPASTSFYISENEVNVSRQLQELYWLYRVHSYSREKNSAAFYVKNGDVSKGFELTPTTYKAIPV